MFSILSEFFEDSSTKLAGVMGIFVIVSQLIASFPYTTNVAITQVIATVLTVLFSTYNIYCLNSGGCSKFAWFTLLLPFILFAIIIVLNMFTIFAISSGELEGESSSMQNIIIDKNGIPIKENSTINVENPALKTDEIYAKGEVDFYSKNQFQDYAASQKYKNNFWTGGTPNYW